MSSSLTFKPISHDGMSCELRSPIGRKITLRGTLSDIEPEVDGDSQLLDNPALVHNAWAYAKNEKLFRRMKLEEKKASHRKQADAHATTAKKIAALIDRLTDASREGWCSGCYTCSTHRLVHSGTTAVPVYLCSTCGSPTLKCAAPRCGNMATRGFGAIRIPRFCAEHRHEIPGFERAADKVDSLDNYETLMGFDSSNLSRVSRFALTATLTAGVVGTGGLLAAPAVGGAIGTLVGGYTGAAASSYGLAWLGFGSIASGGFGMVGGTYVVAAAGAALGGALGANVTSSYISEDKSFRIELFRAGVGTPVIICRGFMTDGDPNWADAVACVERRYPDSPIYFLRWGSKELKALGGLLLKNVGAQQAGAAAVGFAARASKMAAKRLGAVAPVLLAADMAKNPWHTALVRADRTGVALAGILARTTTEKYILVGHSLGARAMITAAETLATSGDAPKIETIHLLGAAEGRNNDWRALSESVTDAVHNYFSQEDGVLKYAYAIANAGSVAIGFKGIGAKFATIKDHDVTKYVKGHSQYFSSVRLR